MKYSIRSRWFLGTFLCVGVVVFLYCERFVTETPSTEHDDEQFTEEALVASSSNDSPDEEREARFQSEGEDSFAQSRDASTDVSC
ncbi:MAG: hypothetical protein NWS71_08735 [Opitutales bacterium]|jgi:hypothetical protein|nr:hypothetical protein [Opitutales bacterium]